MSSQSARSRASATAAAQADQGSGIPQHAFCIKGIRLSFLPELQTPPMWQGELKPAPQTNSRPQARTTRPSCCHRQLRVYPPRLSMCARMDCALRAWGFGMWDFERQALEQGFRPQGSTSSREWGLRLGGLSNSRTQDLSYSDMCRLFLKSFRKLRLHHGIFNKISWLHI